MKDRRWRGGGGVRRSGGEEAEKKQGKKKVGVLRTKLHDGTWVLELGLSL